VYMIGAQSRCWRKQLIKEGEETYEESYYLFVCGHLPSGIGR
jgi:hypothetical protein